MTPELGPFEPGTGRLPPYLAGRETEQETLLAFVGRLRGRQPAPSEVALYGPRGNGKTALLRWLQTEVAVLNERPDDGEPELETLWFTPSEIATVASLVSEVASPSWLTKLGITKLGLPGAVEVTLEAGGGAPTRMVADALLERVRKRPLVLLLDEAHTLDPEVGNALLNAAQKVGGEAPFLLVLAGTPDLPPLLRRLDATFVSRARQLRIGRLGEAAAGEAIRRPLRDDGIEVSREILARVFRENHGYPFFVQHWGEELWRRSRSRRRVVAGDVDAAREAIERIKGLYYSDRYAELKDAGLLSAARAVADAFRAQPGAGAPDGYEAARSLTDPDLSRAVRRGLGDGCTEREVREAEETLRRLGYVWGTGVGERWEPGIPSLMAHVWRVVPSEEPPPAAGATSA